MAQRPPYRLILASASPARRDLLAQAGYEFEVVPANITEPDGSGATDPRQYVQQVAWLKAAAVAPRIAQGIVLAADTVSWHQGRVIGKPVDAADARRILRLLAGQTHELWTGVVLWHRPSDVQTCWQEVSRVAMVPLSDAEIDTYLATRLWEGCSGAYAIQEEDDPYVRVVEGSRSNVIGLPLETLARVWAWVA
ncbi:MAG: Maf family protein, partial [Gemmataceae bacterium]|nr:Maf family protein [Gemmataceae bacterium]MDW8263715.1 Maf family protein [Gemmataceae bacterium]